MVERIQPRGKTPIAASLERVGELLAGREEPATVVLVSDGLETCGGDPCAVAKALQGQGHKLVIHVVGFGMAEGRAEPLRCIARVSGGRYFQAADAKALAAALARVREAVVAHRPIEPEPPVVQVPREQVKSRVKAVRASRGKVEVVPAPWVRFPPYFWSLVEVESGQWVGRTRARSQRARAGVYHIAWREAEHGAATVLLPQIIEVAQGKNIQVPIDTGLQVLLPEGIEAVRWWWLQPPGTPPIEYPGRDATLGAYGGKRDVVTRPHVVAAGRHHLWVWQQEHASGAVDLGPVNVEAGKVTKVPVDFGFVVQFADWLEPAHPFWQGVRRKPLYQVTLVAEEGKDKRYVWWGERGPWLAPPGRYTLYLKLTEHGHSAVRWGEIAIPQHGFAAVRIDSGVRLVPEDPKAKPPERLILVDLDTGQEILQARLWTPLPAPPGRYRLDWQETAYSPRETLVDELVIDPGILVEVAL